MLTGYCLLVVGGKTSAYRIVFKPSLPEAIKAISRVNAESKGRIEVLRMINGDTISIKEDDNEYSTGENRR